MPESNKVNTNENRDKGRLREILAILAKHEAVKGFTPKKLRAILEDLGPTYIKLGQIMSMRPDMLPADYCRELVFLRVEVNPMAFSEVKEAVESEYKRPLEEVFSSFEQEPLGAASIAQVHEAALPDGSRVAVKVQRPGIRETMAKDIALLHKAAGLLKLTQMGGMINFNMVLDEMWAVTQQETDFLMEAQNAREFQKCNQDIRYVGCPAVIKQLTTSKVLVMEYIDGIAIDDTAKLREEEYDLEEIGLKLADHYVKQVIDDGFFHADPHPGNLRIRDGKIIWLDLGMMGRLSERDRKLLQDGIKAVAIRDIDALQKVILTLCERTGPIDQERFREDIAGMLNTYGERELGSIHFGELAEEVTAIAKTHRLSMPEGVFLLGRGLMNLEGVLSAVSPEIDLLQIIANRMSAAMLRDFDWQKELLNGAKWLYESSRKTADVPASLSDLLRLGASGQAKLNLNISGAERPLASVHKMVNRGIQALLAAALFIGSCLLCGLELAPKLWGIPVLGLAGLLGAVVLGVRALWGMRKGE